MKPILNYFIKASVLAYVGFAQMCSAAVLLGTPSGNTTISADTTAGASFVVGAADLLVTQLGAYDNGLNGLAASHQVGLWNSSGTLLASTTVPAGTGAPLVGSYRYAAITPQQLTAGATYTIGALFDSSVDLIGSGGTAAVDPAVSSANTLLFYPGPDFSTLNQPTTQNPSGDSLWAANMEFSAVPEPTTVIAICSMLIPALAIVVRRRKNS